MYDKIKILYEGQACRKCHTSVIRKQARKGKVFKSYLYCPSCKTIYFVGSEDQRLQNNNEASNINPNQKTMFVVENNLKLSLTN